MKDQDFVKALHLKLTAYSTRVRDLEAEVSRLTVKLAGVKAELVAAPKEKLT